MKVYELTDKIYYFSLVQNNRILKSNQSTGDASNVVVESVFEEMLTYIEKDENNSYILDFSSVNTVEFKKESYNIIICEKYALVGINEKIFEIIKRKAEEKGQAFRYKKYIGNHGKYMYLICFCSDNSRILENFFGKYIFDWAVSDELCLDLSQKLLESVIANVLVSDLEYFAEDRLKYLESSNVYVNCYLNVKRLFMKIDVLALAIKHLERIIHEKFLDVDSNVGQNVCLLGVSNNGIILARILGYVMKMDVKSINHIGPKYCLNYDNATVEQYKKRKYILVSDVICLGGEYRIAKGMISILESELLGAVGIVQIRNIYREEKKNKDQIYAIINNINEYGCDYKIYIDRRGEELCQ